MHILINNLKRYKYLLVLVIFSFAVRIYSLETMPPALNWDEVSHGYNAYSILKTGADEWGNFLPITNFRAYGDYPLPLNLYLTIPFIATFGINVLSIRLPHVILGSLMTILVYFLSLKFVKHKKPALFAAFLVAIGPWYFFTSRFVVQSNLSVFFLVLGVNLFLYRKRHRSYLPISLLAFGLTLFSYHTTRIFTPLLLFAIILIYRKKIINEQSFTINKKWFLLILLIFFAPLPFILLSPEARARSEYVFLIDEGAINSIIELRNSYELPAIIEKILFNRYSYFILKFINNYFSYFSPRYLFQHGGTQYQFSIPNQGLVYWINLPFFYAGILFTCIKIFKERNKDYIFPLTWLLISPIPASITKENYAVLRSTTMLPLPEIFIVLGVIFTADFINNRFIKMKKSNTLDYLLVGLATINFVLFGKYINIYFREYKNSYSWAWQYGYDQVVDYAKQNYQDYDKIIVTKKYGEPHEFFLFYWPWDPIKYKSDPNLIRYEQSNWFWVDRFDKFYFVNDWEIPIESDGNFVLESGEEFDCDLSKCFLITSPGTVQQDWDLLETIYFLDGKPAFEIYEN